MARAFVTGGSGFIGGALVARLVERGDEVVALARSDAAAAAVAARGATPVQGDVLDEGAMTRAMDGCDIAFHVAGVNAHCPDDPAGLLAVNVAGAERAVRAAAHAGVPRLVYTSSAASVGEAPGTVGREDSPHRGWYLSLYDRSKHEGEQVALRAGREAGVEVVAVCPSSVQGPGRATGTGKFVIAYLNGKLKFFVDTHVSLVDVADTVEGHLLAAERGAAGERYLLNGASIPSREALRILAALSGGPDEIRMIPPPVARAAAVAAETVARARGRTTSLCRGRVATLLHGHRYDGSRATRELGLHYRSAEDTFRRTMEWAVAEGLVSR